LRRFPLLNNATPHRTRSVQATTAPPPIRATLQVKLLQHLKKIFHFPS
jgi:hypothetical protein